MLTLDTDKYKKRERNREREYSERQSGKSWQANPFSEFVLCFRTLDITLPLHIPLHSLPYFNYFCPTVLSHFALLLFIWACTGGWSELGLIVVPNNSRWVPSCLYSISTLTAKPTRQHLVRIWVPCPASHRSVAHPLGCCCRSWHSDRRIITVWWVRPADECWANKLCFGRWYFSSSGKEKKTKNFPKIFVSPLLSRPSRIRVCHKFVCFI